MTKITMMNEDITIEKQDVTMQEVSAIGLTQQNEQVDADDLLYLINQTNDSNKDAVSKAEAAFQDELNRQKEEEERLKREKEEAENLRRFNAEQAMIEERERREREEEEARLLEEQRRRENSFGNRLKNKTGKLTGKAKNAVDGAELPNIRSPLQKTFSILKKVCIAAGVFILYNICSLTLAYFIIGGFTK